MENLRNCKCGAKPTLICATSFPPKFYFRCFNCGISTSMYENEQDAINDWNEMMGAEKVPKHNLTAHWILHDENGPLQMWLECSSCHKGSGIHEGNYYCHWCGARMDDNYHETINREAIM